MIEVVGIHGIAQQQGGRLQLLERWRPALADGLERAGGRPVPAHVLDLAFYGDLFLQAGGTKGLEAPGASPEALSDDELSFLADIGEEVVEAGVPLPETKGFGRVPKPVGRLAAWLDHRFGVAGRLLFLGDLVQVRRFQREEDLAEEVLGRVRETLALGSARVLIGHSLGSVVALEAVSTLTGHGIDTLLTLGSPLGLRTIRRGLSPDAAAVAPGLPPGVHTWVNIRDLRDPVACAGGLAATWARVTDQTVDNGGDPHAVERYLGKRETGTALLAAALP